MSFSILGLGTVLVDHQVRLQSLPEADAKAEILSDCYQVGGPVPTALALLSLFGAKTSFIGKWSTDEWGEMIELDLNRSGVSTGLSLVSPEVRSGFAHVWVEEETGRRSVAAYRGTHLVESDDLVGVNWADYQLLHLDGWSTETAIEAALHMKTAGGRISVDLGSPKPNLETLVGLVDWVNCPLRMLEKLYPGEDLEKAGHRLIEMGASEVTVTNGDAGAWLIGVDGMKYQRAYSIQAVDTNGAGDVFSGAMIYGTFKGWNSERRLRFASAAAALKCCTAGNREALPTLKQIESFLLEEN